MQNRPLGSELKIIRLNKIYSRSRGFIVQKQLENMQEYWKIDILQNLLTQENFDLRTNYYKLEFIDD